MGEPENSFIEVEARNWESSDLESIRQQEAIQHPSSETPLQHRLLESLFSQVDLSLHK